MAVGLLRPSGMATTTLRRTALALAAVAALLSSAAAAGPSDGLDGFTNLTGVVVDAGIGLGLVAATNVSFSIHDLWAAGTDRDPGFGVGVAELFLMPPQLAVGLFGLVAAHDPTVKVLGGALALWTGALLVHGLCAVVTQTGTPPARSAARRRSTPEVDVSPTVLLTGNSLTPAVSLSINL